VDALPVFWMVSSEARCHPHVRYWSGAETRPDIADIPHIDGRAVDGLDRRSFNAAIVSGALLLSI